MRLAVLLHELDCRVVGALWRPLPAPLDSPELECPEVVAGEEADEIGGADDDRPVDEPNQGRPISRKVASLMKDDCSSGIFIFTADERFVRETKGETEEVWRPSENVVYELGAASMLYENRIVIFKEKGVTFPTDFSDP